MNDGSGEWIEMGGVKMRVSLFGYDPEWDKLQQTIFNQLEDEFEKYLHKNGTTMKTKSRKELERDYEASVKSNQELQKKLERLEERFNRLREEFAVLAFRFDNPERFKDGDRVNIKRSAIIEAQSGGVCEVIGSPVVRGPEEGRGASRFYTVRINGRILEVNEYSLSKEPE